MPSTFSDLKIELIATGEQPSTWGITTNTNLGTAIEEAISGRATATFTSDADLTLTLVNSNTTQIARNYIINVTSSVSLTVTRNLIVPTIDKPYIIENNTTGSQAIVVKTVGGTGVTIPNGRRCMVYANSTNVVEAFNFANITGGSITGITDLAIADGGTGASDATGARTNLGLGTIATQAANSVAITGGTISNVTISSITDLAIADGGTGASTAPQALINLGERTGATGSIAVPVGTTGQRDGSPQNGYFRYNSSLSKFEGYASGNWSSVGGGATGAGVDAIFNENDKLVTGNYTIGQGAMISGVTVTIATPGVFTLNNHGFVVDQPLRFTTTGALPTGLISGVEYYVISAGLSANNFQVSTSVGGGAVNTSGTQSGTHSVGKVKNATSGGSVSIAAGATVTVPAGSTWHIL